MRNDREDDCFVRLTPVGGIQKQLEELPGFQSSELKEMWSRLYGSAPPKRMSRELMIRAIAYKLQEKAYGGMSSTARRKLAKLVAQYETRGKITLPSIPLFKPGTKLIREWQGNTHSVIVLENGFEFEGERYRSLSAVAQKITGAHWSGPRFFGVRT